MCFGERGGGGPAGEGAPCGCALGGGGGHGCGGRGVGPRGGGAKKGGAPKGGAPKGGGPKFRAFFFLSRHNFLSFFSLLRVLSWNFGGVFEAQGH